MEQILDNSKPVLYNVDDIIEIFKISRTTAYQLMKSSGFPSFRINNRVYVEQEKLNDWLSRRCGKTFKT